jgi:hypothetical protein
MKLPVKLPVKLPIVPVLPSSALVYWHQAQEARPTIGPGSAEALSRPASCAPQSSALIPV